MNKLLIITAVLILLFTAVLLFFGAGLADRPVFLLPGQPNVDNGQSGGKPSASRSPAPGSTFPSPAGGSPKLNDCAGAGEYASRPLPDWSKKECCQGLEPINQCLVYRPESDLADENGCVSMVGCGMICSACGDGFCEEWENPCNCSQDCRPVD